MVLTSSFSSIRKHLVLGQSDFGGLGVFASQGLLPGTFISLYAGEFIDHAEAQHRYSLQQSLNEGNYVLCMRENDKIIGYVDPTYIGNIGWVAREVITTTELTRG